MFTHTPFLGSEFTPAPASDAAYHVIPAPMELSVSYGSGTAKGPEAILLASDQLEAFERGAFPGKDAIYTAPYISPNASTPDAWLDAIEQAVGTALDAGAKPLVLGGEHTVTLGAIRAYKARGEEIGIIHFDAHADLRADYEGSPLSHACVLRRCHEMGCPIAQFGTRAYCADEAAYRAANADTITAYDAMDLAMSGLPESILPDNFPKKVYVTFDVDGWDPSIMPATGTPVPGGLMWYSALFILKEIAADREIIGADLVELAPIPSLHHADFSAAKMCQHLIELMEPEQIPEPFNDEYGCPDDCDCDDPEECDCGDPNCSCGHHH